MPDTPAAAFEWLALTKLAPPELRPDLIPRPRLFDALRQALATCPLTLVSAPAGSGKTTLLACWLASRTEGRGLRTEAGATSLSPRVAWLSLDASDNDPARFFAAISAALQRSGIPNLPPLDGGAPEQLRLWLTRLINALLAADGAPRVLLLDDLHWISDPAILALLDQLIERLPPKLRLVAATRHDPPLGLARLRVRRQVAELHLSDLRFTTDQAASWLNTALQLDIPTAQIAPLVERTEGWAAGISWVLRPRDRHLRRPAWGRLVDQYHRRRAIRGTRVSARVTPGSL
jgi:LuxR family maltose regulon positive regulatory protein